MSLTSGVALVVSAAVGLAQAQCKDKVTSALCLMSAVVAFYYQSNWIFPLLIVVGGLVTLYTKRNDDVALPDKDETIHHLGLSKITGGLLIVAWVVIWVRKEKEGRKRGLGVNLLNERRPCVEKTDNNTHKEKNKTIF